MKTDNLKALEQKAQSKLSAGIDRLQEYRYFGRIVWTILLLALLAVVMLVAKCQAAPLFVATTETGTVVTLTDEPCTIPVVKNLPLRATWSDRSGTFEGCYGSSYGGRLVLMYFDDLHVMGLTSDVFRRAEGI